MFLVAANRHASESGDDYLKAILELGGAEDLQVTSNALAERLGVRTPSVTGMLQKLAAQRPSLVLYEKHRGVRLSAAGKRRAWELVRHHRLLELFLHDVLHYSWDEVHEEADRLEHFISERFEDRVAAILGDPEIDPHGHLIPRKHASGSYRNEVPLSEWEIQTSAIISSVSDRDPAALRELERLGMTPGAELSIENRNAAGSVSVRLSNRSEMVKLTSGLAARVLVAPRQE
ncbi:MAG TPA: metal-dependent transcriptional regulator [Bryobacteraceae bacterium]|nr:metal-dependent transcriptional regulator [Bryobacteraceae bacterium]